MSFFRETPKSARELASEKGRRFPLWGTLLLMVCGLTILGVMAYLFLNRLTELNQQVADLSQQVEGAIEELQVVAEKAEASSTQASRAEESALEAARGRDQAEAQQAAAQETAEQAREEAQRANQDAKLAQEEAQFAQEEARLAQEEAERIRKERDDELNRLQTALNRIGKTRRTALGLVMTLGSDSMQFEFDKATLTPENRELLSRIVGILLTSKDYGIYVYGHTDSIGSEEYNLELSKRRALSVRDYLADNGITPEMITTEGFGKSRPLITGSNEEARAKNRRVEIGIVDTVITFQKSVAPKEE